MPVENDGRGKQSRSVCYGRVCVCLEMLILLQKLPMGKVTGVIHVGAHEAEELREYLLAGIKRVAWVEANPEKAELLKQKIVGYPEMSVGNFAADQENGKMFLNLSNNGQSSSLLELGAHRQLHPDVFYTGRVEVDVKRSTISWSLAACPRVPVIS